MAEKTPEPVLWIEGVAVTRGVDKTLQLLTETPNEASVTVLLAGLDSAESEIQRGSLLALLARRGGAGQNELICRWAKLDDRLQQIIGDYPRQVAAGVRHAILSRDREHCSNGCAALLQIREYELIPALVTAITDPGNPQAELVAQTLVELSEMLYDEIAGPRTKPQAFRSGTGSARRDPLPATSCGSI